MNIVIIEDEELALIALQKMLDEAPYDVIIKKTLSSVSEAKNWLTENSCDIIITDINLGDGQSFEIFNSLNIKTPIIFITAYDEFVLESFNFFAIDYLLKPFDSEKLYKAIEKYTSLTIDAKNEKISHQDLFFASQKKTQKRFLVTQGTQYLSIKIDNIHFFMAQGKDLFLFNNLGESFLYDNTILNLEHNLPNDLFFKINRKYIISHRSIKNITKYDKNRILIELYHHNPEENIIVSTTKTTDFKKWLNS